MLLLVQSYNLSNTSLWTNTYKANDIGFSYALFWGFLHNEMLTMTNHDSSSFLQALLKITLHNNWTLDSWLTLCNSSYYYYDTVALVQLMPK